jgi:hypothetical protein
MKKGLGLKRFDPNQLIAAAVLAAPVVLAILLRSV